ncbi:hypothetical protein GL213_07150 [Halogeometricum borinquense]|uniref:Uncharacterized protein n=1 Tax=Halogeometricum borinquense TaxID=60847 RepID=A0A6C0UK82_9EURY|nr:hypothetical protein [Halogeometricum borinquense]QIB74731.1 hypothetical protein G3I44_10810 [Halogeometricum borinquense]QIQ76314.1 hypothetical protein GL213_07150 [Halogeometricum borinquense]
MAKVSIGLRGWRFEESEVFTDEGEFRPLDEVPDDTRRRLIRLTYLQGKPCDACYLIHGEAEKKRCNQAEIVYGEPMEEVLLCSDHEADFLYWFREEGGSEYRGEETFRDEFHEWFAADNRAPDGYGGLEHVDTGPDELPTPPDPAELNRRLNENYEGKRKRIDLKTGEITYDEWSGDEDETEDEDEAETMDDVGDLDLGQDYPTK